MTTPTSTSPSNPRAIAFGRQLRAAMLKQNVSSRELGRRLASESLTAPAARRSVMKYLRGDVLPSPDRRGEIADALGVERDELSVDEDDEESDLFTALYTALRDIARHEVRVALERSEA